jgi:hypothetical protein
MGCIYGEQEFGFTGDGHNGFSGYTNSDDIFLSANIA